MLIVGLNGSPNEKGNTKVLLEKVLETAAAKGAQTEIIEIPDVMKSIDDPFCEACSNPCSGQCFEGTELERVFDILTKADGVVLGSPVYFGTVCAQLKAFFDKTRRLRKEYGLYNTVGAGVTVGASRFGGQETTIRALHDIMLVHGMIIVGDGFGENDCGHHGVCGQKESSADQIALKRAEIVGKRMVEVCTATQGLRK